MSGINKKARDAGLIALVVTYSDEPHMSDPRANFDSELVSTSISSHDPNMP